MTYLEQWIDDAAKLMKPKNIYMCDGSEQEAHRLIEQGLKEEVFGKNVFYELHSKQFPNSFLHRSHASDVARTEHLTFMCHPNKETAGPNNHWMDPAEAKALMSKLSDGCMKGRTMYVIPYMMGNPLSPYAKACVQVTDSIYVAVSMRIMTRVSNDVITRIGNTQNFIKGMHSIGDIDPTRRFIMHFPDENFVWSIGSGYGGNALLGKKCISLRIASCDGLHEGWLAEHMIIIGVEDPKGNVTYIAAALPSACGKTNLAMMESALPGYKIWTLGDDIAWLNPGPDGRLYAINPENGFFGVVPGTSMKTNPNMMRTLEADKFFPTLFTNVGETNTHEPWWEDMDGKTPANVLDWQGVPWDHASGKPCAHPNSRFTVAIENCLTVSKDVDNPQGVPISAIIFGARRSHLIPLVSEAASWQQGVFAGSRMGSETTAAATHNIGHLRRDPMAMLPFCGYNMADYFGHWLAMEKKLTHAPKIFSVNWFRVDENGKYMWPGFGQNTRVLKWIIDRVNGNAHGKETPIGTVPLVNEFDTTGLDMPSGTIEKLFDVTMSDWKNEIHDIAAFYEKFGEHIPSGIREEFERLKQSVV